MKPILVKIFEKSQICSQFFKYLDFGGIFLKFDFGGNFWKFSILIEIFILKSRFWWQF